MLLTPLVQANRYTSGWTLAESFYTASRLSGWIGIVLGDPICRACKDPTEVINTPGDKITFTPTRLPIPYTLTRMVTIAIKYMIQSAS